MCSLKGRPEEILATNSSITNNSTAQAKNRLDAALARLEKALTAKLNQPDAGADLAATLETAQREVADLKNKNQIVSTRLDTAISNLKTIIGD